MESLLAPLQNNVLGQRIGTTRWELHNAIFIWIDSTYHRHRWKDALG